MSEFPIQWAEKQNSPALLAALAQFGPQHYFSAEEINQAKNAMNELNGKILSLKNRIIHNAGFSIVGNNFILNSGWIWEIEGAEYNNEEEIVSPITLSAVDLEKQVLIVLNVNSSIQIINGVEVTEFPAKPPVPDHTIVLTDFPVSSIEIGTPTTPIIGNLYIEKNVYTETTSYAGDGKLFINNSANYILLDPTITVLKGLILGDSSNNFSGRPNFITNKTGHDVTILNEDITVDVPFRLPNSTNFILKNGFTISLIWSSDGDVEGCLRLIDSGNVTKRTFFVTNRSIWSFPNVAVGTINPLIGSNNFSGVTANVNTSTDDALTALNFTTSNAVSNDTLAFAPYNCKLKNIYIESRTAYGSFQSGTLRFLVGSSRTITVSTAGWSILDSQVVHDGSTATVSAGNFYLSQAVSNNIIIPKGHGIMMLKSYSRKGIALTMPLRFQLEFEEV